MASTFTDYLLSLGWTKYGNDWVDPTGVVRNTGDWRLTQAREKYALDNPSTGMNSSDVYNTPESILSFFGADSYSNQFQSAYNDWYDALDTDTQRYFITPESLKMRASNWSNNSSNPTTVSSLTDDLTRQNQPSQNIGQIQPIKRESPITTMNTMGDNGDRWGSGNDDRWSSINQTDNETYPNAVNALSSSNNSNSSKRKTYIGTF